MLSAIFSLQSRLITVTLNILTFWL